MINKEELKNILDHEYREMLGRINNNNLYERKSLIITDTNPANLEKLMNDQRVNRKNCWFNWDTNILEITLNWMSPIPDTEKNRYLKMVEGFSLLPNKDSIYLFMGKYGYKRTHYIKYNELYGHYINGEIDSIIKRLKQEYSKRED